MFGSLVFDEKVLIFQLRKARFSSYVVKSTSLNFRNRLDEPQNDKNLLNLRDKYHNSTPGHSTVSIRWAYFGVGLFWGEGLLFRAQLKRQRQNFYQQLYGTPAKKCKFFVMNRVRNTITSGKNISGLCWWFEFSRYNISCKDSLFSRSLHILRFGIVGSSRQNQHW